MDSVDITIVGAGVVGLALAYHLSQHYSEKSILVLERHDAFGRETSSRNSEVIHAGIYYPPGSLKASLCVRGSHLLYELCAKYSIGHKKITKVIVACDAQEEKNLDKIFACGTQNGALLERIGFEKLKALEPNVSGIAAIYSPNTGIIDSHGLMRFFSTRAQAQGVMISFNSELTGAQKADGGYHLRVNNSGEQVVIASQVVINCAGLDADTVAGMFGMDIKSNGYQLHYCKGQYFRVAAKKSKLINRLVYPVPKPKSAGLGVHATLDLAGSMRLGPDERYLYAREKDYNADSSKLNDFAFSAAKLMPFITAQDLSADTAGIRPKLQAEGGDFRDFMIQEESGKGLPGLINLIGIESPGLTGCLAIAEHVMGLIR